MGIVQQKIYTHSDTKHTYNINTETIAHKQYYVPSCIPRNVWTVGLSHISKTLKGPKREIFVAGIFAQIRPIWIGDLGTMAKNPKKKLCLGP